MRKNILSKIFDFIKKHPTLILIIFVILGILFFLAFQNQIRNIQTDYINLLPLNYIEIMVKNRFLLVLYHSPFYPYYLRIPIIVRGEYSALK